MLLKGDTNLYTIDTKLLPKTRPRHPSPFTGELKFNESTRSTGQLAEGWRKLDLRKLHFCTSESDSKIFKILIQLPAKKGATAPPTIKEVRYKCRSSCLRKIWIKKLKLARYGNIDDPVVPCKPRVTTHYDSDQDGLDHGRFASFKLFELPQE